MGLDIGTLTGRIELQDNMSSALMQIKTKLDRTGDALVQLGMTVAGTALKIGAGAAAIGASVVGISAGILALADKGSRLNGITEEFDRLAKSVGTTSEALIGPLNAALKGTVDATELMSAVNKSLGAGVRLTSADLATMGETARAMARATGTDAVQAFETLNSAMMTGNMRALKRIGLTIDVADAERKFAASIGTTRDELNAAGILEAKRVAMLEAMRKRVDEMGIAEMSMGERIKAAQVAVAGWFDMLAQRVAKSKDVENAFIRIQGALERAFGTGPQKLMDLIIMGIDWFARKVGDLAPYIERAIGAVKSFWDWLVDLNDRFNITGTLIAGARAAWSFLEGAFYLVRNAVRAVVAAWESMPDWLQRITTGALKLGAGVAVAGGAVSALTAPLSAMISRIDTGINIFGNFAGALYSITNMTWLWQAPIAASTKLWAILLNQIAIYRATLPMLKAQVVLWTIAENAAAAAQAWFTTVTMGATMALTTLSSRLGITAAATYVSAAASSVAATAKGVLAAAINFVSGSSLVMGARMWIQATATGAAGASAAAAAIGVTALGIAMQAALWVLLPLGIAWAAWNFGKWLGSFPAVQRSMIWLAEWLGEVTFGFIGFSAAEAEARRRLLDLKDASDNTAATAANGWEQVTPAMLEFQTRMEAVGRAAGKSGTELEQFVRGAIAQVNELKEAGATSVAVLTAKLEQIGILAPDAALRKLADEARALQANGATLTPQLQDLVDRFKDVEAGAMGAGSGVNFLKDHTDELNAAMKSMSGDAAIKETNKLTAAYEGLARNGIKPTTDALTSYRDGLRAIVDIYANRPATQIQGVTTSGSSVPSDLEANLKKVNAQVEALQYKKGWETSIGDGLKKITTDSVASAAGIRTLEDSLRFDTAIDKQAIDIAAAIASIGDVAMLTKVQAASALEVLEKGIKQLWITNKPVPQQWLDEAAALHKLVDRVDDASDSMPKLDLGIEGVNTATRGWIIANGRAYDELGNLVGRIDKNTGALLPLKSAWSDLGRMMSSLGDVFDNINSKLGQSMQVIGGLFDLLAKNASKSTDTAAEAFQKLGTKIVGTLTVASEVVNQLVTGTNRAAVATRGAVAGAAAGAAAVYGVAQMLGVALGATTLGIGAAVGALAMMVISWNAAGKAARAANREADATLADLRAKLIDTYGSLQQVDIMGQMLGVDLAAAWGDTTTAGLKHFSGLLDEFNAKLKGLSEAAQEFGFTWTDMSGEMAKFFGGQIGDNLLDKFKLLVSAGVDVDAVTKSMSGAINDYIRDCEKAGIEVPAAFQPIIDRMRELGLLGEVSNIAAEAGYKTIEELQKIADKSKAIYEYMVESGKYSSAELARAWEAYTKAADEALGGTATAFSKQMEALNAEMKTLTEAVAAEAEEDVMGVIETQQRERIAQIEAEQAALAIQEAEAIAATASVTEAAQTDFDTLFEDVVASSADAAAEVARQWRDPPWGDWEAPELPGGSVYPGGAWDDGWGSGEASNLAAGGVVYAAGGWSPQGSDTVPAMLTPGERVLSVAETSAMSRSRVETRVEEPTRPGPDITININAMDPVGLKKVIEQEVGPMLVSAYRRNVNGLRTDTRKELVE